MTKQEIEEYLSSLPLRYERDGYDKFIKKTRLSLHAPLIHVIGSNGKSTVCEFLNAIYRTKYHVGLLTNSYLISSLECIKVDGITITEEEFTRIYSENAKLIDKLELSRWEILCYVAFSFFNEKKIDLAIVESSLGGMNDASYIEDNDSRLVILTSLSLEHTDYLGTTLSQIALNKVSVLNDGSKLLIPSLGEELTKLLRDYADSLSSELYVRDAYHFEKPIDGAYGFHFRPYGNLVIQGKAKYLVEDACFALEAVNILQKEFPLDDDESVKKALITRSLPCMVEERAGAIFDYASNPEAAEALVEALPLIKGEVAFLFAARKDANIASILPFLSNYCPVSIITSLDNEAIRHQDGYFFYLEDYEYVDDPLEAYNKLKTDHPEAKILITGSKELVRYMRKALEK